MKSKLIVILVIMLGSFVANAQNPYEIFGYQSNVEYETKVSDLFTVTNKDTTSLIQAMVFKLKEKKVILYDKNDSIVAIEDVEPNQILRFLSIDRLAEEYPSTSPYAYCLNNPILFNDPTGMYPVVTITNQQTGQTASQRVLGYSGGVTTQVPLYNVVVTDTENKDFRMTFSVTRDAWTVERGNSNASNVAFEPKDGKVNHFTGKVMPNGYPQGNGTEALKLTQYGSEVIHAETNQTAVDMGYRNKTDVASGIMLHVGGYYNKSGNTQLAASEGCFGIVNPNNSPTNPSNEYSNNILNTIINQANSSQTDKGKILMIIQKREGNDYPKTQQIP